MTNLLSAPPVNPEKSTPEEKSPPTEENTAEELREELKSEVKVITSNEERESQGGDASCSGGSRGEGREVMEAIECVSKLKELLLNKDYIPPRFHNLSVPDGFRCPISKELMRDPVILSSGATYDRPFILKWLKEGKQTCPQTQQVLSHTNLTPNHLVRDLIAQWCKNHEQEPPTPLEDADIAAVLMEADRAQLNTLLEKMRSSISDQKDAAKQIRLLTKRNPSFGSDNIPQLIRPLTVSEGKIDAHPDLQEDIITTLFNLSMNEDNKKPLAEDPQVILLLNESLKCGTTSTRSNAAASLSVLSVLDSNKELIWKSGALKSLLDFIEGGHPSATKDAAQAIFNLCLTLKNRGRATREGAVGVIMKKIMEGTSIDVMLFILVLLTTNAIAIQQMVDLGVVGYLLRIVRESTHKHDKEKCAEILNAIVHFDPSTRTEISKMESRHGSISKLADNGFSRASKNAYGILARLSRN